MSGTPQINGQDAVFREVGNGVYTFTITVAEDTPDVASTDRLSVNLQLQTDIGRRVSNTISQIAANSAPAIDATRPIVIVESASSSDSTNSGIAKVGDRIIVTVRPTPSETGLTAVGDPTIGGLAASFASNPDGTYSFTTIAVLSEGDINVDSDESLTVDFLLQDAAGNNASAPILVVASSLAPTIDTVLPTISTATVTIPTQIRIVVNEPVQLSDTATTNNGFTINSDRAGAVPIDSVSASGNAVTITLTSANQIQPSDALTLSYTSGSRAVLDVAGNTLQNAVDIDVD